MEHEYLMGLAESTRDELVERLVYLAHDLEKTADALKRAKNLEELRSAFNPLGELQDNRRIDSLCGRLGAYCKLLAKDRPDAQVRGH